MYIHRVGRSGRAGKAGKAVLLYSKEDLNSVQACEEMAVCYHYLLKIYHRLPMIILQGRKEE